MEGFPQTHDYRHPRWLYLGVAATRYLLTNQPVEKLPDRRVEDGVVLLFGEAGNGHQYSSAFFSRPRPPPAPPGSLVALATAPGVPPFTTTPFTGPPLALNRTTPPPVWNVTTRPRFMFLMSTALALSCWTGVPTSIPIALTPFTPPPRARIGRPGGGPGGIPGGGPPIGPPGGGRVPGGGPGGGSGGTMAPGGGTITGGGGACWPPVI